MRHAHLYVISRSRSMVLAEMPLLAFENTMIAWNQSVSGVSLLWKIVPEVGAIWLRHLPHWYCLRPAMRLYVPPQEHSRLWSVSKIKSKHASSLGNCLRRLVIPYFLLFICPKYIPRD